MIIQAENNKGTFMGYHLWRFDENFIQGFCGTKWKVYLERVFPGYPREENDKNVEIA